MNRALLSMLVLLSINVSLMSCKPSDSTGTSTASVKRMKIGVSIPAADHGWTAGVGYWAKQAMALHPEADWIFQTADTPQKQTDDIQTMLERHVDGLVILATESAPITPIAKEAHDQGVFMVNVDRRVYSAGDRRHFS